MRRFGQSRAETNENPALFWRAIRRALRHLGASRRCSRPRLGGGADGRTRQDRLHHGADGRTRPQRQIRAASAEDLGRGCQCSRWTARPSREAQTNPATVPGIYTKLLDVDKVDLVIGGYGTNLLAPAMPIAMQRKKVFIGLLGNAVNSAFNYPNYFSMMPAGPDPS